MHFLYMSIFGTSGIRDLCPQTVNGDLAFRAANFFASKHKEFAVAYDSRKTGMMLKSAVLAGATWAGARAYDLGVCPTPTLAYFSQIHKCPAIMITASHNPYEYNGLKFFLDGHEISSELESEIEKKLLGNFESSITEWKTCGQITDARKEAVDLHIELIRKHVDVSAIKSAKPKVIVDCANMAGSFVSPVALLACGCNVIKINCDAGAPSPRSLEPKEDSLQKLCEFVVSEGADFAVAHDGDADRAIIIDEQGVMLGLDTQLAIATNYILDKISGAKIISTVESSLSLREAIQAHGGSLEITPVGSMRVAAKMRETRSVFGGEPCGEYIFDGATLVPDGILSGVFFAEIFAKKGKLSTLASQIRIYPMKRSKIACSNEKKSEAMKKIRSNWIFSNPNFEDGIRSDESWGWVLVRPSGTEPYIRITIEAKDSSSLIDNYAKVEKLVHNAIKNISP